MKIGVLTFGYQQFNPSLPFTANLGDNMQSIAVRLLLERLRIPKESTISINRDDLANYSGPDAALIMNGVFYEHCFPLPPQIQPIFIGFCTREDVILKNRDFFARNAPIGCRDNSTAACLRKHGIAAYVTGCLTMSIPERKHTESADKVVVVLGGRSEDGESYFPSQVFRHMPSNYFDSMKFVYQRMPMTEYPISEKSCIQVEAYARKLLNYYADHARLIITPLHHATSPCLGLGIPVILCREEMKFSFDYLAELLPVYTPENFNQINWKPQVIEMGPIRQKLEDLLSEKLSRIQPIPHGHA